MSFYIRGFIYTSHRSWGATRDIGRGPLRQVNIKTGLLLKPLNLGHKAIVFYKGCNSNFEVNIFQILKVATNETTTLNSMYLDSG